MTTIRKEQGSVIIRDDNGEPIGVKVVHYEHL